MKVKWRNFAADWWNSDQRKSQLSTPLSLFCVGLVDLQFLCKSMSHEELISVGRDEADFAVLLMGFCSKTQILLGKNTFSQSV